MVLNIYASRLLPWGGLLSRLFPWSASVGSSIETVTQPYSSLTLSYSCLLNVNHVFDNICVSTAA